MKLISMLFDELVEARRCGHILHIFVTAPHSGLYKSTAIFYKLPNEDILKRIVCYIAEEYGNQVVNLTYVYYPNKATLLFETEQYPRYS